MRPRSRYETERNAALYHIQTLIHPGDRSDHRFGTAARQGIRHAIAALALTRNRFFTDSWTTDHLLQETGVRVKLNIGGPPPGPVRPDQSPGPGTRRQPHHPDPRPHPHGGGRHPDAP